MGSFSSKKNKHFIHTWSPKPPKETIFKARKTDHSRLELSAYILRKTNRLKTFPRELFFTLKIAVRSDFISVSPKETPSIHPIIKG